MIRPPPLPLVEKAAGMQIEDMLPEVLALQASPSQMLEFCALYRRLAICKLLFTGEPADFFADLFKAARAYTYFLESPRGASHPASRSVAFFDAVACDDLAGAARIAQASAKDHTRGEEYEDDFCALHFWMELFGRGGTDAQGALICDRMERFQGADDDPRLVLCRALLSADAARWVEAVDAYAVHLEAQTRELLAAEAVNPDDVPTTARVSIELLALLRMGELRGLPSREEYLVAPSVARLRALARRPADDAWKHIDSYYELR